MITSAIIKATVYTFVLVAAMFASYVAGYLDGMEKMRNRVFDIIDEYRRKMGV